MPLLAQSSVMWPCGSISRGRLHWLEAVVFRRFRVATRSVIALSCKVNRSGRYNFFGDRPMDSSTID